jgi:hypothetical protein
MDMKTSPTSGNRGLYRFAAVAALVAMGANLLDLVIGFGETEVVASGARTAQEWFTLFQNNRFHGLYMLGILNVLYMAAMVPLLFAVYVTHRRRERIVPSLALAGSLIGTAVYIANSAAIPMLVLSERYAAATSDVRRAAIVAAAEAILATGEDFTPGAFAGIFLTGVATILMSYVMLRGGVFPKRIGWIGLVGFSSLMVFTILATFVSAMYEIAFYGFGMVGGLFALAWFLLAAIAFFRLAGASGSPGADLAPPLGPVW